MALLGIDIGTTHCKAGLFAADGRTLKTASRRMQTRIFATDAGATYTAYDPADVWEVVAEVVSEACAGRPSPRAVGIASMAESGLLADRRSGQPRTPILPWFEMIAGRHADRLSADQDPCRFFIHSGLRVSYKLSLAKLLWMREDNPTVTDGAIWLSVADYIAYRLTGAFGTDYSLAGRTGAFEVERKAWNEALLQRWGLSADTFPPAFPSGMPVGDAHTDAESIGIPVGTPVSVAGHDHIVAAFAAASDEVFDSMGTAEALVGGFSERPLTAHDYESGLLSGRHSAPGRLYWLGGLSSSGGAVEWLREILSDPPLTYAELTVLAGRAPESPTGLLFFPYLSGSGSPHTDGAVRAALCGLGRSHGRAEIARAVLEGTAYEMEFIRRAGERLSGRPITRLTAAGGGTRNRLWLQIKADVSGVPIRVPDEADTTLLCAALLAGVGAGYFGADEARAISARQPHTEFQPDAEHHVHYHELFDHYSAMQAPLRQFGAAAKERQG